MNDIIKAIEEEQLKQEVPEFSVGDTVRVYGKIKEGNRERVQVFEGDVLKKQGGSNRVTFTEMCIRDSLNVKNKKVVSILSGGNMDVITMSSVVQHGLIFRDRIFTVSVLLPDKPGELSRVAAVIAEENGNVIKLEHNQFVSINRSAAVELRITLEAFGTDHKNQILAALEKEGYQPKLVRTNI